MPFKPLPIGVDNFEKLILGGYYYVDKTWLIKKLLDRKGEVNLFTRPRRFGKSLSVSMLQCFFENTGDIEKNKLKQSLFKGLKIMEAGEQYSNHMNGYPVISLSLKSGKQPTYEMAEESIRDEIIQEFNRHNDVKSSGKLLENEVRQFSEIQNGIGSTLQYAKSLEFLSLCLKRCYGKNTIILIDEYDVPLENAWFSGFYDRMVSFVQSLFESALKTNPYLEFAVMTGCLRISKESIFTGLNNPKTVSILSEAYGEHFGFSQAEVDTMLDFYGRKEAGDTVKEWYDGYLFGTSEVYNPWSVINYTEALAINPDAFPAPFWKNTSSNAIVRELVEKANSKVKAELEQLLAGGVITKPVHEDITYEDIYDSEDNLWNFLFFTGYLKKTEIRMVGDIRYISLAIPNREVRYIYNSAIMNWFRDDIKIKDLSCLYQSLLEGDSKNFQKELSMLLMNSISYMDGKEEFYHGFLLGILENLKGYLVTSNREAGFGRYDIAVRSLDIAKVPVVIELKISDTFKGMSEKCETALRQIESNHYDDWLPEEGYKEVWNYGISFFKKQCRVKAVKRKF